MASRHAIVPFSNAGISKTPCGPLYTTVWAYLIRFANSCAEEGPMSSPIHPSGMPSSLLTILMAESLSNLSAATASVGRWILTSFFLASFSISGTSFAPSSSNIDLPIFMPSTCRNVQAIPPEMTTSSTRFKRFLISGSLSLTFFPPSTATNGLLGRSNTLPNALSSFLIRNPAAFIGRSIPIIELCARWQVPKASLTYMSASFVSDALNAFFSSLVALIFLPCLSLPFPCSAT
mmetsp:Transcript_17732/g.24743  ORF Transcript_17732/g.24743 Transcript_17732/m.24743 type:complete len:234 (-) Transcript_17732:27-728(-)